MRVEDEVLLEGENHIWTVGDAWVLPEELHDLQFDVPRVQLVWQHGRVVEDRDVLGQLELVDSLGEILPVAVDVDAGKLHDGLKQVRNGESKRTKISSIWSLSKTCVAK